MPIQGYFDTVFAESGSTAIVPDAIQVDGSVSYTEGYGVNYTLDPGTNPSALNIEETKMNQIFFDITTAIQNWQQNTSAPFITSTMNNGSPYSYPKYALVLYDGVVYISTSNSNTDTPPSSKWQALNFRNLFTADTNFYVSSSGNDSNAGTSGSPWLTLQHAFNILGSFYDAAGFTAIINLGTGTFAGASIANNFIGGNIVINGNGSANTTIGSISTSDRSSILTIQNTKLLTSSGSNPCINADQGSRVAIGTGVEFGSSVAQHILATNGAEVSVTADYIISGSAASHYAAAVQGIINFSGSHTITLSTSLAFTAFADCNQSSIIVANNALFAGSSATGSRYTVSTNSVINTNGGGANFFPGNSVGTSGTGGQYV